MFFDIEICLIDGLNILDEIHKLILHMLHSYKDVWKFVLETTKINSWKFDKAFIP